MTKNDILVYSFYTTDEYYSAKAEVLRANLEALQVPFLIEPLEVPPGKEWPDICRQKIGMIHAVCKANPDKKVFWIDVDCSLLDLPDYIRNFSADIIGFQRGFSSPERIGYNGRSRFWEPCFWGISTSAAARSFIDDAYAAEQAFEGRATDDYFFEEAWRKNAQFLSFQIIPSVAAARSEEQVNEYTIFLFGASGNVSKFIGSVAQHQTLIEKKATKRKYPLSLSFKYRLKVALIKFTPATLQPIATRIFRFFRVKSVRESVAALSKRSFRIKAFSAGKAGDRKAIEDLGLSKVKGLDAGSKVALVHLANAMCDYRMPLNESEAASPIRLAWWADPAPGNFGDWLSPYIIRRVAGRPVEWVNPSKSTSGAHVFSVGSIAKFAQSDSIILGSGVSAADAVVCPNARVISLRGPRTGRAVRASGGNDPGVYGDPAIILPRLFAVEKRVTSGKVGFIRHFKHVAFPIQLPSYVEEVSVLASRESDIEALISKLHEFDYVISSAMHGFIVCQAYGIPAGLVTFAGAQDAVHGDGIKYLDYFEGVGLPARGPDVIPMNLRGVDLLSLVRDDAIDAGLVGNLYDVMSNALMPSEVL